MLKTSQIMTYFLEGSVQKNDFTCTSSLSYKEKSIHRVDVTSGPQWQTGMQTESWVMLPQVTQQGSTRAEAGISSSSAVLHFPSLLCLLLGLSWWPSLAIPTQTRSSSLQGWRITSALSECNRSSITWAVVFWKADHCFTLHWRWRAQPTEGLSCCLAPPPMGKWYS